MGVLGHAVLGHTVLGQSDDWTTGASSVSDELGHQADSRRYTLGDVVVLRFEVRDEDGDLADPGSVTIEVTHESGASDDMTADLVHVETGRYQLAYAPALTGRSVAVFTATGDYAGKVIGYYDPLYTAAATNGVYLEVITTAIVQGAGNCAVAGSSTPHAIGHVFGKAKLLPGSQSFGDDIKRVTFSGKSVNNPNLFDGPWNDYPGAGYAPNSAHFAVGYSEAEYNAIAATVTAGYVDIPVAS